MNTEKFEDFKKHVIENMDHSLPTVGECIDGPAQDKEKFIKEFLVPAFEALIGELNSEKLARSQVLEIVLKHSPSFGIFVTFYRQIILQQEEEKEKEVNAL